MHDVTHSDALWGLASDISGPGIALNPLEAFVFGGAALIHDLGLAVAAYAGDSTPLEEGVRWRDAVASVIRGMTNAIPMPGVIDAASEEVKVRARQILLRELHAERAGELASASWEHPEGERLCLLEDAELRGALGSTIGRIAESHWWPVDRLRPELGVSLGAPAGFPGEWHVRPLIVACILRVADAAQLDIRRAPPLLRALRRPDETSDSHWSFQERLLPPTVEGDRLHYTSGQPFPASQADAWWLCFERLRVVDRELRDVDALLADFGEDRFAVRMVAGIEDPQRLARLVRTDGWLPVNAVVHVSDVTRVVRTLAGDALYGSDQTVPLRELIQNACDAIEARRRLDNKGPEWGTITVRSGRTDGSLWIEVQDDGIGMSREVLTRDLLDFGYSLWDSPRLLRELPGLAASGFVPIGKFGIGFFAAFIWGDRVWVTSRRYEKSRDSTLVLEFEGGVRERPLVRQAREDEFIAEGGTRVRIWPNHDLLADADALPVPGSTGGQERLANLCRYLCPACTANVRVEDETGSGISVVAANDWRVISGQALLERVSLGTDVPGPRPDDLSQIASRLRPVMDGSGNNFGRCALVSTQPSPTSMHPLAAVTIGGLRAHPFYETAGILLGRPENTARSLAEILAPGAALNRWATDQAELVAAAGLDTETAIQYATEVRGFGGNTGPLVICQVAGPTPLIADQVRDRIRDLDDFISVDGEELSMVAEREIIFQAEVFERVSINSNVFVYTWHGSAFDSDLAIYNWPPRPESMDEHTWGYAVRSLNGLFMELAASAWSVPLADVIDASQFREEEKPMPVEVGTIDGAPARVANCLVVRRPR